MQHKLKIAMPLLVLSSLLVACKGNANEMDGFCEEKGIKACYKTINIKKDNTYKFKVSNTTKLLSEGTLEEADSNFFVIKSNKPVLEPEKGLPLNEIYKDSIKVRTNKELTKVDSEELLVKDTFCLIEEDGYKDKLAIYVGVGSLSNSCKSIEFEFKSNINVEVTAIFDFGW